MQSESLLSDLQTRRVVEYMQIQWVFLKNIEHERLTQQRDDRARDLAAELLHIEEMDIENERLFKQKDEEIAALRIQLKAENPMKEEQRKEDSYKYCAYQ